MTPETASPVRSAVEPDEIPAVSLDQMLATGVSYRQIDYWCKRGYLRPIEANPGYGCALQVVGVELATAAGIARSLVDSGTNRAELGGGVFISIDEGVL